MAAKKDAATNTVRVPGGLHCRILGQILRMHRRLSGKTRKEVQLALLRFIDAYADPAGWAPFRALVDPKLGGSLGALEAHAFRAEKVFLPDILILSRAYGIPALMLDPARATSTHGNISTQHTDSFIKVSQKGVPFYGFGATYSVPKEQLEGTENIAIVHLGLDASPVIVDEDSKDAGLPHSDHHRHPGEELLYVESGSIDVRFGDTGLHSRLQAGSLIHFDSRLDHSAWNPNRQPAQCFIIRLYRPESRRPIADEMGWLFQEKLDTGEEVLDRLGLGRFLATLCSENMRGPSSGGLTLDALARRAAQEDYPFSRSKLARIHYGKSEVLRSELTQLARIYEVEPMILYNFLLPYYQHAIAVHGMADTKRFTRETEKFLPEGVTYRLPFRRLASSEMMISLVTLKENVQTEVSRHAGWELIKPLEGDVSIILGTTSSLVTEGSFAHFDSSHDHQAINKGKKPVTILSVRFISQ